MIRSIFHVGNILKYQAHKTIFNIKSDPYLKVFEQFLMEAPPYHLECSSKIEKKLIHPKRFCVQFDARTNKSETKNILQSIVQFFDQYKKIKAIHLNYHLMNRVLSLCKISDLRKIACGVDFRTPTKKSRLKLWVMLKDSSKTIPKLIALSDDFSSMQSIIANNTCLFGIDLLFTGETHLKLYPTFSGKQITWLKHICCPYTRTLAKQCKQIFVSFNSSKELVIHFMLKDPKTFIQQLGNRPIQQMSNKYNHYGYTLTFISCLEKELSKGTITKANLYC